MRDEVTLQGIKNGSVHGTVVQDPYEYGKRSIEILHSLFQGRYLGHSRETSLLIFRRARSGKITWMPFGVI
jgi:ABC-type sugar transport system substrate-binding protein